ncbi:MAG: hypothetical protein KF788_18015 [Piscinibacter sp.]|nr:hypothetical protein [Piscinibacter sp.]
MTIDLTRYNRAGLARVQYVDANAAVLLERLRAGLAAQFPDWAAAQADTTHDADPAARNQRLVAQYEASPEDMLWQLTRSFARAGHVLAATLDAYANEGWIGTATQWDNVRRLVAMLDYAPHPAASAYAPVALHFKPGQDGRIEPGLQLRHAPADGSAPLVFETLEPVDGRAALNELRPAGHDRNPQVLTGTRLVLEGRHEKLRQGEPIVLEDERDGTASAHLLRAVSVGTDRTELQFAPPLTHARAQALGWLRVHAQPKERLAVRGPATEGATIDRALQLATPTEGLAPGDIVVIGRPGAKPVYRRLREVDAAARRLVFHEPVGPLDLLRASVARPVIVPISRREAEREVDGDTRLRFLRVAGDWSRLLGLWLADLRQAGGREVLPMYECTRAEYTPVKGGSSPDPREGYTILGLAWDAAEDGVDGSTALQLVNPQNLLAPPPGAGPWRPDTFLQQGSGGAPIEPLVGAPPKHLRAGDWAVLVNGTRLACAKLRSVAIDESAGEARYTGEAGWAEPPEGPSQPFFLAPTRLHGPFALVGRARGWNVNATPLAGQTRLALADWPDGLRQGLPVIAANERRALRTVIDTLLPATREILLRDPLPRASTAANLRLLGNVVLAGHGATRPEKVLGSGDATRRRQQFLLEAGDVSFVADATMPAGVRADVQVRVGDERWTQVGNLADSPPTAAHYQVRAQEDGRLAIQFGDGANGRRLPTGANNLRVVWRQGVGVAGNLPPGSLAALVKPHPRVAQVEQPIASAGGSAREGVGAIRTHAAASLLTLERAVSLEDFASLLRSHAAVAQARAFAPATGLARRDRVAIHVVPAGGAQLTPELAAELRAYAASHGAPNVEVEVHEYVALPVALDITVRVRLDAFEPDLVAAQVRAALIGAFGIERRGLGQVLYRGEVFAVVERVTGVENSSCSIVVDAAVEAAARRVARDPGGEVLAVVPHAQQCAHLPLHDPVIGVTVEAFTL